MHNLNKDIGNINFDRRSEGSTRRRFKAVNIYKVRLDLNIYPKTPRLSQLPSIQAGMVLEYTSFFCVIFLHRIKCSGAVLKLSG